MEGERKKSEREGPKGGREGGPKPVEEEEREKENNT